MPRRWQRLRTAGRAALAGVLLLWGVFVAAWLALHWAILPHIDEWRPRIEAMAGRAIGLKLTIGAIEVRSGGWVPALTLRDLRLFDAQGREALRLRAVHAALAPQSLLSRSLRLQQVLIDGARLDVRRDAQGRLHVAGLDWEGSLGGGDTRARDWFLSQHEFVVRNAELRWTDERSGAPPLALTQVDAVLRNGVRRHALRLDATPPPGWGQRFSLRGRFNQPLLAAAGEFERWSGTLYADFPQVDVAALRRHAALSVGLNEGSGALRAWLDIDAGAPHHATLDFALDAVSLRVAPELQALQLQRLQGRLDLQRSADGVRLRASDLALRTHEGLAAPTGALELGWRQAQDLHAPWSASGAPVTGGELKAAGLDLELLAHVAGHLPLSQAQRSALAGLAPRGRLDSLQLRWDGSLEAPARYQLQARLAEIALRAGAPAASGHLGRPGLQGARIELSADERAGQARLVIQDGALVFPGLWEQEDVPLQALDAALAWQLTPQPGQTSALEVRVEKASFANADAQGEFSATWRSGGDHPRPRGWLELNGRLQRADAARTARYLPLSIPAAARRYVQAAVQGGANSSASFRVRGDLAHFPFRDARLGEFHVGVQARDLHYAFVPGDGPAGWPALEQASGEIDFDRVAMHVRNVSGRVAGVELRGIGGAIDDLGAPTALLTLQAQGQGPAAGLLRVARLLPLGPRAAEALAPLRVGGAAALELGLSLPIHQLAQAAAHGSVQLLGNDLQLTDGLPPLLGARGQVDFAPQGLQLRGLTARWLGGDSGFDGSIGSDGTARLNLQGTASAEALRAVPALARAAAPLRGQAAWRAVLAVADGRSGLTLNSNLVGMGIELPPPLAKPVASALPLRLQLALLDARSRDSLQLELGELLKARLERDLSGAEPRVLRAAVAVADDLPPLPAAGLQASLNLGRLDVDAWQAVLEREGLSGPELGLAPQTIRLRAGELRSGTRALTHLDATLTRPGAPADAAWRARVQSDQLDGSIDYAPAQAGRVVARLQRLAVPQAEVASVEQLLSRPPAGLPALDVVAERFELRGRDLGRLQVQAVNRPLPTGAREWQLERLALAMPEAQFEASGRWAPPDARMVLDFRLDLSDGGAFLERLGAGQALLGGKGQVQGRLSWAGSPLTLDYPSLAGQLRLDLGAGQFLHADVGGARLLGVLSLASLPRRLSLDFRDLFQKGFAFDAVEGDISIARGVAETANMHMRGAQATVLTQGRTDLLHETQDLRVLVVPNFDASGAALATMAINPAIGLGTLLAQWALREPLIAAGTSELHITGSWVEPQVQRVSGPAPPPAPAEAAERKPPG